MVKGKERHLAEAHGQELTPKDIFEDALKTFLTQQRIPSPTLFSNFGVLFETLRSSDRIHHSEYFLDPDEKDPEFDIRRLVQGRVTVLGVLMSQGFVEANDQTKGHLFVEALFKLFVKTGGLYAELVRNGPETEEDFLARYHALYDDYMAGVA